MKLRMGVPKYGAVWCSFLLLFCVLSYLKYSQLALVAMACFMVSYVIGMIAERREHEAKNREHKVDGDAKRSA
jgi:hypothetical protein